MATATVPRVGVDVFAKAIESFETTLKAGIKAQENSLNWWTEVLEKATPLREWQAQAQSTTSEVVPVLRKNGEEALKAYSASCQEAVELAKKTLEISTSTTPADVSDRMQALWDDQLGLVRKNTDTMMQLGNRTAELWKTVVSSVKVPPGQPAGPKAN